MIKHHPKETTLVEFAAGTLNEARSLIVATHLEMCPDCRRVVRDLEHMGGMMLDQAIPAAMSPDARQSVLDRFQADAASPAEAGRELTSQQHLARYEFGAWRWVGPGVHWRSVGVPQHDGTRVFMLKAAPGTQLPSHRHAGTELTCVLEGAFLHQGGRFGPGDCDDADSEVEHTPSIETGVECVCLVAMQGSIRLNSLLGRLIQPFVRL